MTMGRHKFLFMVHKWDHNVFEQQKRALSDCLVYAYIFKNNVSQSPPRTLPNPSLQSSEWKFTFGIPWEEAKCDAHNRCTKRVNQGQENFN